MFARAFCAARRPSNVYICCDCLLQHSPRQLPRIGFRRRSLNYSTQSHSHFSSPAAFDVSLESTPEVLEDGGHPLQHSGDFAELAENLEQPRSPTSLNNKPQQSSTQDEAGPGKVKAARTSIQKLSRARFQRRRRFRRRMRLMTMERYRSISSTIAVFLGSSFRQVYDKIVGVPEQELMEYVKLVGTVKHRPGFLHHKYRVRPNVQSADFDKYGLQSRRHDGELQTASSLEDAEALLAEHYEVPYDSVRWWNDRKKLQLLDIERGGDNEQSNFSYKIRSEPPSGILKHLNRSKVDWPRKVVSKASSTSLSIGTTKSPSTERIHSIEFGNNVRALYANLSLLLSKASLADDVAAKQLNQGLEKFLLSQNALLSQAGPSHPGNQESPEQSSTEIGGSEGKPPFRIAKIPVSEGNFASKPVPSLMGTPAEPTRREGEKSKQTRSRQPKGASQDTTSITSTTTDILKQENQASGNDSASPSHDDLKQTGSGVASQTDPPNPGLSDNEATDASETSVVREETEKKGSKIPSDLKSELSEGLPEPKKRLKARGVGADKPSSIIKNISARELHLTPLGIPRNQVPTLAHDLQRVLFNPGVYQLQDPRTRVYNFDPHLQNIMPVSDFNFKALKDYIVSSQDTVLRDLAAQHNARYYGSSSSMTSVLTHFHFLLSQWRPFTISNLSQSFTEPSKSATNLSKAPTAVFVRWKDGAYAIDADKQFDSGNILAELGKSLEKFLTLPPKEFERYRKGDELGISEEERKEPEAYHYTTMDDFLMRSQIDAYDPRLPGSGTFDLKTRAVVSIRMNPRDYDSGLGYQINRRYGNWQSYEREYYDMVRSAFLKYSLQVRMGRMDGIFVAFHNIERIFGFQYISLREMDFALHGQTDTILGDQEFALSLKLWNEVLNRASEKFPEQSLRLHFETREGKVPFMYIFAEPVTKDEIEEIQSKSQKEIEEYTRKLHGMDPEPMVMDAGGAGLVTDNELAMSSGSSTTKTDARTSRSDTSAFDEPSPSKPVLGLVLVIRNTVNGDDVERPQKLSAEDEWNIGYNLTELEPQVAHGSYTQCRRRRHKIWTELREGKEAGDNAWGANSFMRQIGRMVDEGRRRSAEEELKDRERGGEVKVLYPDDVYGNGNPEPQSMTEPEAVLEAEAEAEPELEAESMTEPEAVLEADAEPMTEPEPEPEPEAGAEPEPATEPETESTSEAPTETEPESSPESPPESAPEKQPQDRRRSFWGF